MENRNWIIMFYIFFLIIVAFFTYGGVLEIKNGYVNLDDIFSRFNSLTYSYVINFFSVLAVLIIGKWLLVDYKKLKEDKIRIARIIMWVLITAIFSVFFIFLLEFDIGQIG